jgi:serine phosphatase RsbU (regulator of sigma subunit)
MMSRVIGWRFLGLFPDPAFDDRAWPRVRDSVFRPEDAVQNRLWLRMRVEIPAEPAVVLTRSSPGAILAGLNDGLSGQVGGGFVTCCCARFGPAGSVTIANAGHPSPYCDGREVEVGAGLPLGIAPGVEYAESVVRGERFTFVSDGVVEAENAQREISIKSAREIAEAAKAWGQTDDITVVTVQRTG